MEWNRAGDGGGLDSIGKLILFQSGMETCSCDPRSPCFRKVDLVPEWNGNYQLNLVKLRPLLVDLVPEWNGNALGCTPSSQRFLVDLVPEWNGNHFIIEFTERVKTLILFQSGMET